MQENIPNDQTSFFEFFRHFGGWAAGGLSALLAFVFKRQVKRYDVLIEQHQKLLVEVPLMTQRINSMEASQERILDQMKEYHEAREKRFSRIEELLEQIDSTRNDRR